MADADGFDPIEHDLELTVSALKDGPTDLGIAGGLVEIERWQSASTAPTRPRSRRSVRRWPSCAASWRATHPTPASWRD